MAYFHQKIYIFDVQIFTVVDRGSDTESTLMADNLRPLDFQICLISTETPRSICLMERSHLFLQKEMAKLLPKAQFEPGHRYEKLKGGVKMA